MRLVAAITLLTLPPHVQSRGKASLFEFSEQVTEISPAKFSTIAESVVPWVLDCYSPACPHCVSFKPKVCELELNLRHTLRLWLFPTGEVHL